jgi:hypothetical protein
MNAINQLNPDWEKLDDDQWDRKIDRSGLMKKMVNETKSAVEQKAEYENCRQSLTSSSIENGTAQDDDS